MRLGGRGVYLCPRRECVQRLRKKRVKDRFFYCLRREFSDRELEAFLEMLLERQDQWGRAAR